MPSFSHSVPAQRATRRQRTPCGLFCTTVSAPGIDPSPQNAGAVTHWTKAYWEAVHPFDLGGAYPNFMMDDEGDARLKATYGDNYARLAAVKKTYDPANLFRVNQNIKPAA